MDHAVLVDIDVNLGAEVLNVLDSAGAEIAIALWATFSEFYSPRLVMAAEWLDAYVGSAKYGKVRELLNGRFPEWNRPTLFLINTTDPFVKELREQYVGLKEVRGMRLYGQSFGGRYVEEGYVYRIA
jgi:hypothetical protein